MAGNIGLEVMSMWLIKTFDGTRERNIVAHGWFARRLSEVLTDFGYRVDLFLVSEHYDPITATKFILDPVTNEPLKLPKDYARKLRDDGYFEVYPFSRKTAVAV